MNIIDKIKKLLALGTNNTNESEMAAALAKAAEIALKNNLDIDKIKGECEGSNDGIGCFPIDEAPRGIVPGSTRILWARLTHIFGASAIMHTFRDECGRRKRFRLSIIAPMGLKETILYLGHYLERAMQDGWIEDKSFILSMPSYLSEKTRRERYRRAFVVAVCQRCEDMFQMQQFNDCRSLVLSVRDKVEKYVKNVAPTQTRPCFVHDMDASALVGRHRGEGTDIRLALSAMDDPAIQGEIQ